MLENNYSNKTLSVRDNFNATTPANEFYNENLEHFYLIYGNVHKPLSLAICIFGVITNVINVVVLTRHDLITPSNILLTGMSLSQLFLALNYVLLLSYNALAEKCYVASFMTSYNWQMYKLINVNLNVAFHTTALIHTMLLTVWRFCALKSPRHSQQYLTNLSAKKCVILLYVVVPLMCCPTFFTTSIETLQDQPDCGYSTYYELSFVNSEIVFQAILWTFGVTLKLIPGITVGVLSFYLIRSLKKINTKKRLLMKATKQLKNQQLHQERLTKMLVAVSFMCIAVEVPHGVVNVLTGVYGQAFASGVYDNLGELFEMLTLLYSSINFILYCLMSSEFQNTFKHLCFSCLTSVLKRDRRFHPLATEIPLETDV